MIENSGAERNHYRRELEHRLEESELKWRNVLMRMPQIGISLDPEGRITFANDYFLQLTGWTADEILGRDWFETCIPEDIREGIQGVFRDAMSGRHPFDYSSYQNPILTKTGERREVQWANVLTRDVHGAIVDVTCLGVDITERVRLEQALREANERLELALRSTRDGYFDIDLVSDRIYASARLLEMLTPEASSSERSRSQWRRFVHPDDREVLRQRFEHGVSAGETTITCEVRLKGRDGGWFPVLIRFLVTRDVDGVARRVTGVVSDISDLKAAQAETARRLAELEQWYRATMNREKRVLELKAEVNELARRLGMPPPYESADRQQPDREQ